MTESLAPGRQAVRDNRTAAYTAWAWVVVFTGFHVYWLLGGRFGLAGDIPETSSGGWLVYAAAVWAMFAAGLVVPLAAAQTWGRLVPRWMLLAALWAGAAVLLLRGLAGVVDELVRAGGSATGLTGLTVAQVYGTAHPTDAAKWTGRITDWYFTLGGVLFAWAAFTYRRASAAVRAGQ